MTKGIILPELFRKVQISTNDPDEANTKYQEIERKNNS